MNTLLERAIGLHFVLEQLTPRTPWGRNKKAQLRPFSPEEKPLLESALDDVEEACSFYGQALEDILSGFREVHGTLVKLREEDSLSESELFALKRFVLRCEDLREVLLAQKASARFDLPDLGGALHVLDPSGMRDPAFSAAHADDKLRVILHQKLVTDPASKDYLSLLDAEQLRLTSVLAEISRMLELHVNALEEATQVIGDLDLALAKAVLVRRYGGVRPVFGGEALQLKRVHNPSIADFSPLTFRFTRGSTVITGANMGGKSTALYTVALNVQLSRMGLYAFAQTAHIPLFTDVCVIAGSHEGSGLSAFAAQASLLAEAINGISGYALILVDELASGTNPEEGAAIAAACTEYLGCLPAVAVLTTHYSHVAGFAGTHYRAMGYGPGEGTTKAEFAFFPVEKEQEPPREAIHVLSQLGMPQELITRAQEFVDKHKRVPYNK